MSQVEALKQQYPDYNVIDHGTHIELMPVDMHPQLTNISKRSSKFEVELNERNIVSDKMAKLAMVGAEIA